MAGTTRRRGWGTGSRRWARGAGRFGVLCALAVAGGVLATPAQAAPGVGTHGPVTEAFGFFPEWYEDKSGLRLELCTNGPLCAATLEEPLPNPGEPVSFPDNFPSEAFWWMGEATVTYPGGSALLVLAQEAAFAAEIPMDGDQWAFGRLRIRAEGLEPGAWYRFTHPYGSLDVQAVTGKRSVNYTRDIGCLALCTGTAFALPAASDIGPNFLRWDDTAPAAPEGHIGDPAVPHTVIGSEFVPDGETEPANHFKIERISGRGGSVVETLGRTDHFVIQGKLAGPPAGFLVSSSGQFGSERIGSTTSQLISLRNGGSGDLTLEGLSVGGTHAGDFAVDPTACPMPLTLTPGASCAVPVSFAPTASGVRRASVVVMETGGRTRSIALAGTGTPVAVPPPPVTAPSTGGAPVGGAPAPAPLPPAAPVVAAPVLAAPAPATVAPTVGAAVSDLRVAGVVARSTRVTRVTLRRTLTRARARANGLRLSVAVPQGTRALRVRVYRLGRNGARKRVATAWRAPRTRTVRVTLRDRALRRALAPGAYHVEVTPGRTRSGLGTATRYGFRITR